jgi:hypothetical protein
VPFAALTALAGCVVPFDHEFDGAGGAGGAGGAPVVARGCLPFHGVAGLASLTGDGRSLALADGSFLWLFDAAAAGGADIATPGFLVAGAMDADCTTTPEGPPTASFAPSPIAADAELGALDGVVVGTTVALFYQLYRPDPSAPFGLRGEGSGVATRDAATGMFVPGGTLFWSPDRPSYGTSAVLSGGLVYVYGSLQTAPLTFDCFVARAPAGSLTSAASYTYFTGSGWSASPDDAAPIAQTGPASVRFSTALARWLMTYASPLGHDLVLRTAIAPEGPWSAPIRLGACDLTGADANAFCGGGVQHLETAPAGSVALTYRALSFSPDEAAPAEAYWPRLALLPLPPSLP